MTIQEISEMNERAMRQLESSISRYGFGNIIVANDKRSDKKDRSKHSVFDAWHGVPMGDKKCPGIGVEKLTAFYAAEMEKPEDDRISPFV